jgi:hypothetical protein
MDEAQITIRASRHDIKYLPNSKSVPKNFSNDVGDPIKDMGNNLPVEFVLMNFERHGLKRRHYPCPFEKLAQNQMCKL